MNRKYLFEKYISTHFEENSKLSNERINLEFCTFDRNFENILLNKKTKDIIEIGFGTGFFIKYLLSKGFNNIKGIEISKEETEFVKKYIYNNVEYVNDTNFFLNNNKYKYDFIFMLDVLEHIPKNETINLLKKVKNALKKDGTFIARVPNASNPFNCGIFSSDFTHEFIFTKSSLMQVNKLAGYTNIEILPFWEEDITIHGRITNITQKIMFIFIKLLIGLCRNHLDPNSYYTKNIYCICRK